jgi:hypothetical protein
MVIYKEFRAGSAAKENGAVGQGTDVSSLHVKFFEPFDMDSPSMLKVRCVTRGTSDAVRLK